MWRESIWIGLGGAVHDALRRPVVVEREGQQVVVPVAFWYFSIH
jgi:lipid-A-disaccharide synthase-like uncharacterized protein